MESPWCWFFQGEGAKCAPEIALMEEFNFVIAGGSDEAKENGGDVFLRLLRNEWADGQPGECGKRANISESNPRVWACMCERLNVRIARCLVYDGP